MSSPQPRPAALQVLEVMSDAYFEVDRDWTYRYVNRRAAAILGVGPERLVGRPFGELFPGPTEDTKLAAHLRRALEHGEEGWFEEYVPALERWFEARIHPVDEGAAVFFADVTERKAAEQELRRREQRYRVLAHAFSSVVWAGDVEGNPLPSETWTELTGRAAAEGDLAWLEAVHPDDQERIGAAWARAVADVTEYDQTYRVRHSSGAWRHIRARGVPVIEDGRVLQWIGVIDDVTEQLEAEDTLRRAAVEDPLTGLPNRAHLLARLAAVVLRQDHRPAAVLYVDIDRFKALNDTLGHAGGDRVLREVAARLRATVRPGDVVSRLAGDEFAVLCENLDSEQQGLTIAGRLLDTLSEPVDGVVRPVTASIGLAFARPDAHDAEAVLSDADAAMYQAKRGGGGAVELLDASLREGLRRRKWIEEELRAGLADGTGLHLHFQPVVSYARGWPSVAEALLRWRARDGTTLPAAEAVAVAEEAGMILEIGEQVLLQACRSGARWRVAGGPVAVSVNVSAQQLARPDALYAQVATALEDSGLAPELLWLEITETMLMEHRERPGELLGRLRALGVRIALDDFGVGYSSLSYLRDLPVDAVKVDRAFVAGLPEDSGNARFVEAIVAIGRAFGTGVVAEGVETAEQLDAVRAAGCTGVQGYLLARPGPADGVPEAIAEAERRAAGG